MVQDKANIRTRFVAIGLAGLLAWGCQGEPTPSGTGGNEIAVAPEPRTEPLAPPVPVPPVDRETLLVAALQAASAAATQADDRAEQRDLDGRRFVVRERFGCSGGASEGPRRWLYEEADGVLRVHFEPLAAVPSGTPQQPAVREQQQPQEQEPEPEQQEEVVAFPIEQPWLLTAACLPGAAVSQPAQGGRVTLAQTFTPEDSRATRPPEAYQAVKRISPEEVPASGLEFVLIGRLQADSSGRVIRCAAALPGGRPDCVVNVAIDGARIQDPARNALIGTWGNL